MFKFAAKLQILLILFPIDAGKDQQEVSGGRLGGKRKRQSLESPEHPLELHQEADASGTRRGS